MSALGENANAVPWFFEGLMPLSYDLIVIDPPWPFDLYSNKGNHKSAAAHYSIMSMGDIARLPVGGLAQRDCLLLMWVTAPRLADSLAVMSAWGFQYKTNITWRKTTPAGKVRMGTGYWARSMHETVLIGTIGAPSKFSAFPSLFDGIAREHSRKPEEFYNLVTKHTSGLRRADVFSRQRRPGWDVFGDEADKFPHSSELPSQALANSPTDAQAGLHLSGPQSDSDAISEVKGIARPENAASVEPPLSEPIIVMRHEGYRRDNEA